MAMSYEPSKETARGFWPGLVFLLIAAAIGLSFWAVPLLVTRTGLDALVLFRQTGHPDYLPQVTAIAGLNFGEISIKEFAGTGVRSFPFVPFIVHGMLYRVAGSAGFMLADILLVVLYAWLLCLYLRSAGVGRVTAELLSFIVISGTTIWIITKASAVAHHTIPVSFWDFRFPRPSVTEVVFMAFLIAATMLAKRPDRSRGTYILFGVIFAALLQSDLYAALTAAFTIGPLSILVLIRAGNRRAAASRLMLTAVSFGLAALPFAYQQLHTSADLKRRWGVFSTNHYRALLPDLQTVALAMAAVVFLIFLAWRFSAGKNRKSESNLLAASAPLVIGLAVSIISGPVSLAVLRQTIQFYHFWDRTERMIGYAFLLCAGWLLTWSGDLLRRRNGPQRNQMSLLTTSLRALVIGFCLFNAYRSSSRNNQSETPTSPSVAQLDLANYRTDFRALHSVLGRSGYDGAGVLGTFDAQIANWWQYKGKHVYLVDMFNSTLPDSEVETRIFKFLRLLGTNTQEFNNLLDNEYFVVRVLGSCKYQSSPLYTPWPLADYSTAARERIALAPPYAPWHMEVPNSERARLLRAWEATSTAPQDGNALDLVILDKDSMRGNVHPEYSERFRLVWSNRTFELWAPQ